jgi:hypothetical protein
MKFNIARIKTSLLIAIAGSLTFTHFANAIIIDSTNNVRYELSSTFTPVSDHTYDVFLAIDTSAFNHGPGFLTSVALQFDNPTLVTLEKAPGAVSDWSFTAGGINSGGCDGTGNFECFQFTNTTGSAAVGVPQTGLFTFEFAVTLPDGTALSAVNDIKAEYNSALPPTQGGNLGITSQAITIDHCTIGYCGGIVIETGDPTPEPSTVLMAIAGFGLLGIGSLQKIRRRAS